MRIVAFLLFAAATGGITYLFVRKLAPRLQKAAIRWVLVAFLYLLAASVVLDSFMSRWGFRGDSARYGFDAMVEFQSDRPYVYRVLFPALVRAGAAAIPRRWVERNEQFLLRETELNVYREPRESWNLQKSLRWHVAYALLFLSLMGGMLLARLFLRQFLPDLPPAFGDFAPPAGALFLMLTFIHGGYVYDFPELVLLLAGALLAARRRWLFYYAVFVLAVLNKETGVFLVAYFVALMWDELPRRRLVSHAAIQLLLGGIVIAGLRYLFRDSAGQSIDWRLAEHFTTWTNPLSYWTFYDFSAPLIWIPQATNIITLGMIAALTAFAWARLGAALRRLLVIVAIVNTILVLMGGYPGEVRNFSLLFPPLFAVAAAAVANLYEPRRLDPA